MEKKASTVHFHDWGMNCSDIPKDESLEKK